MFCHQSFILTIRIFCIKNIKSVLPLKTDVFILNKQVNDIFIDDKLNKYQRN